MASKPEEVLKASVGKSVTVTMKNGKEYRGVLTGFDEFTNLSLADVEVVGEEGGKRIATLVIKGYTVSLIAPEL